MLFPTFTFAVFFAVVLPLSWALRGRATAWKILILTASAVFYGYWDWRFLGLLGLMILVNEVANCAPGFGNSLGDQVFGIGTLSGQT